MWLDGSCYEGKWEVDKFHGEGKMTFADKSTYDGDWRANNRQGRGVYL